MSKELPSVRLTFRQNRLYINKYALACLGNPQFIELLYNEENQILLVSSSTEATENSIFVTPRAYQPRVCEFSITRKPLTEGFRLRLGLKADDSYRIFGYYEPNIEMVVFDIKKGEKIAVSSKASV